MRRSLARRLEQGTAQSAPARWLSRGWARFAAVERDLELPDGAAVVGVSGATLGGAYKTPLVAALARDLAPEVSVAVVARGYRARPRRAQRVLPGSDLGEVGDEALSLARALGPEVPVLVAPSRAEAISVASRQADIVVVDSLLQTRPARLPLSILVGDHRAFWGAGVCPPAGDLRAPAGRLLNAADLLVASGPISGLTGGKPVHQFSSRIEGATLLEDGVRLPLPELHGRRLGLVLAIARPDRVLNALADHGLVPDRVALFADHARPRDCAVEPRVDLWLTTAKCATKLQADFSGAPVAVLEHRLDLPRALVRTVCGIWTDPC